MPCWSIATSRRRRPCRPTGRTRSLGRRLFLSGTGLGAVAFCLTGLSGCSLMVDPFADELAGQSAVTTRSVDGIRATEAAPVLRQRPHARIEIEPQDGTVLHGPTYFQDGAWTKDGGDDLFAWTAEDHLQPFFARARLAFNAIMFPIHVVQTPPWAVMESDGRISRRRCGVDHDEVRASPEAPCDASATTD